MSQSGQRLQDEGNRLQVITAGAVSGLISRFVVAPLDVVKIRLQLQSHSLSDPLSYKNIQGSPVYKGTIPTLQHIVRHEGVTALWKGNLSAELMYVAYGAVQFTTYRHVPMLLHGVFGDKTIPKSVESFAAGAGAGATATAITYPFDLLRTRFAAQGNDRIYTGFLQAIRDIHRDEGTRGFFRGLGPGLAQIVPYMGIVFSIYEYLRVPARKLELPFGAGEFAAGVIASVVAKTGVFPLDLVRKRIQVQGPTRSRYVHKNIPLYERGTLNALKTILATEGLRGLYRGLTVSLIKAAPTSALSICTYEAALKLLIRKEKEQEQEKALS